MKCFYVFNGDVAISNNDIVLASGIELERQVITAVLGTNKGEWFLNENEGINFRTMLTKNPDYDLIKAEIISGLNQINSDYSLTSFKHELNSDRNLILTITISKSSGEAIPLTLDTGGREYVSFEDNIERLTELLNVLVGEVIDNELFDLSYENGVLTVTLSINPRVYEEEIEKVKFIVDSIVPDYIEVVYVISEFPNPPEDFIYIIEDGEVTIISYIGTATTVIVPATIEDLPVTKISAVAFSYRDDVERIKFLDGLTTIE